MYRISWQIVGPPSDTIPRRCSSEKKCIFTLKSGFLPLVRDRQVPNSRKNRVFFRVHQLEYDPETERGLYKCYLVIF